MQFWGSLKDEFTCIDLLIIESKDYWCHRNDVEVGREPKNNGEEYAICVLRVFEECQMWMLVWEHKQVSRAVSVAERWSF